MQPNLRNSFLIVSFILISNLKAQLNIEFVKKNTFKLKVLKDGYLIKTGSGFILKTINKNGHYYSTGISNCHVLDKGDKIIIEFENDKYESTAFENVDVEKDLISFQFEAD